MRAVVVSQHYLEPASRGRLRALAGLGCEVTTGVPDRWEVQPGVVVRPEWAPDGSLQIAPLPVSGNIDDPTAFQWRGRSLRKLFREARPDIVEIADEPSTLAAARAAADARRLRIPYVVLSRTVPDSLSMGARLRLRRVLRGARGVLAENPLVAAAIEHQFPSLACVTVPRTGVNPPNAATAGSREQFVIGSVGRLVPAQGLDVLLRACVKLARPWTLTVSGTGPSQIALEALADRLGIAGRITWLGAQPAQDREQIWSRLDCFVMPSRSSGERIETLGLSALMAMALGVPVIVTEVGALPGTVGSGGLVVPEDNPDALAEALERIAGDPGFRDATGRAGRQRAMLEFSNDVLARRTLEFWESAVTSRASTAGAAAV
ncbi:MAG TPA: glycosyltransferase [Gemmatimonadales bacterium]|nr:glycosyltransferase [Gemmatimonadales bacterium]